MGKELPNSKKIAFLVDKIFKLNHSIVTHIIKSHADPDYARQKLLNQKVEEVSFDKLSKLYAELRDLIREALEVGDEMTISNIEDAFSDDALEEYRLEGRERTKDHVQDALTARLKAFYITLKFVPLTVSSAAGSRIIDSKYSGKLEESLRMQEYISVLESIERQIEIVDIEEYFSICVEQGINELSPAVYPAFLDALADEIKFQTAENNCSKFVKAYRKREDQFTEFPEFAEITQKVEFLRLQEHYKKSFNAATGYLNPNTTYSRYVKEMISRGTFPLYTGLSEDEIAERIQGQVNEYDGDNRQIIRNIYDDTLVRYKELRKKQRVKELLEKGKIIISKKRLGLNRRFKASNKASADTLKSTEQTATKANPKSTSVKHGKDEERE